MTEAIEQGASLTVEQAIANLTGADLGLRFYAAWWIGRFNVRDDRAVARLIEALVDEADRTADGGYPLRRNAARALGKLGDQSAVPGLIGALDCADFYVREAAAQSLEMLLRLGSTTDGAIGSATDDGRAIGKLVERLRVGLDGEGQLVAAQPDLREPYDAYLEALGSICRDRRGALSAPATEATIVDLITPFLQHPVQRTQYAADRAMYQLTGDDKYGNLLIEALRGDDLQLRRAALTDLGAIGYLPAAAAIAETLAENSLKLIALKGLLEKQVASASLSHPAEHSVAERSRSLSVGAIRVMDLMDGLL